MRRALLIPMFATFLLGCGKAPVAVVLGATPLEGFALDDSPNRGVAVLSSVARDGDGQPVPTSPEALEITCSSAQCEPLSALLRPGFEKGTLAILVDASGSNEVASPSTCTGCPTDKLRKRVEAVKQLVQALHARAPEWRIGVFDFGQNNSPGFRATRLLAGYTTDTQALLAGADELTSKGGTYLMDALHETLPTIDEDARAHLQGEFGRAVLVVSDGEDTSSSTRLEAVLMRARELGIGIDAVGFGPADAEADGRPIITAQAVRDLRRLTYETGGALSITSTDSLVDLFSNWSQVYDVGMTQRAFQVDPVPAVGTPIHGTASFGGEPAAFAIIEPN